jgi:superfamily II DNA or RNA helicase
LTHSLLTRLSPEFAPEIRARGLDYFQRGLVRVAEAGVERVLAIVEGTRRYSVDIAFAGERVELSCSCPFFMDQGEPCKHLWATLVKLDRMGYLDKRERKLRESGSRVRGGDGAGPLRTLHAQRAGALESQAPAAPPPEWDTLLREIRGGLRHHERSATRPWPAHRQVFYVFDAPRTLFGGQAVLHLHYQDKDKKDRPRPRFSRDVPLRDLRAVPSAADRAILSVLRSTTYSEDYTQDVRGYHWVGSSSALLLSTYRLDTDLVAMLLPRMCATGRLYLDTGKGDPFETPPVRTDHGEPWELHLCLDRAGPTTLRLHCLLRRDGQQMDLREPQLLMMGGLMFAGGALSRYRGFGSFPWIVSLRRRGELLFDDRELPALLEQMLSLPRLPPLELEESMGVRLVEAEPRPRLRIGRAQTLGYSTTGGALAAELSFGYDGRVLAAEAEGCGRYLSEDRTVLLRRPEQERSAAARLIELGFRRIRDMRRGATVFKLAARRLGETVAALLAEGWHVEAEGRVYRPSAGFFLSVTSGIDWLEVRGAMRFGDTEAALPALLRALKKGENTVRLGDGTYGILPEQWLRAQGLALQLGQAQADHLRFAGSQALVVEQLLQAQPEAPRDEAFRRLREKLGRFREVEAAEPPDGFVGELRGYQKRGLGWFAYLDELGFGGCLADDMGLGKTVQVLALLAARRARRRPPSLVVVPRSLLFNWKVEASRFAPALRVLEHSGPARARDTEPLARWDVVLTTYGTMRNDIAWLKEMSFDYLILDEAQLIKNPGSVTARAVRLLRGRRRLALSGTPLENHLGELWSLFEFLNPGLLGGVSLFRRTFRGGEGPDQATRSALARFLGPFILRRTKEQVAPELPDKVEQTVFCELFPPERRQYRELQDYYRRSLLEPLADKGLGGARMRILEALLRLRQAACHPGLLDPEAVARPGAKIELLLEQLEDVVAEGRKALVFSQFTSLLTIVRGRLEERGIPYEYLDGRTRDREVRVGRFQTDPGRPLFLISLRAGGLGLNLTAAEYVFLLDPWWNPAVEMQAIDRTHRIGQDRKVFAYRLIAKDTVEEKVLELQKAKRELVDSIISADGRSIGELTAEDLDFLLS